MKNIIKFIFASIAVAMVLVACRDDADRNWTTQEPSFTLYDTTLGSNVLYATMADNPFILTWEQGANKGPYTVVVSTTPDFQNKVELGTSASTTLNTTIAVLNTAALQAGLNPYTAQQLYLRVETGNAVSNTISFVVTTYPVAKPMITNPTAGTSFILDANNPTTTITTVQWTDYASYGVDVNYSIGIAAKGDTVFQDAGQTTNLKSFVWTNKLLNDAVLKTGAQPQVQAEFDVKVTAKTKTTGNIILESDVVTIKVTPYANNVTLYLIGDATAGGWDNSVGNMNMYPLLGDHTVSTKYTYTGFFKTGGFKLIKNKGSWDDQYGAGSSAGTLDSSGGSGNINVTTDGYYKLTVDVANLTYTLVSVANPGAPYPTIGIIGNATPNGWDASTAMTNSSFDNHIWYLQNITLTTGEMKFRANNNWDVNWGSADPDFGTATSGGANIPVQAGMYDVYFNDYSGAYVLIKK